MKKTNLSEIILAVTYRCNSRCRMCNIWQITNHDNYISSKDIPALPKTVKDINISGGEPFLRNDLPEIVTRLVEISPSINIIISTNGFATELITKQMQEILAIKPDIGLAFSLDGVDASHDDIRAIPGGFKKVLTTIQACKDLGVKRLRIGFTMGDYNIPELKKVYQLASELDMEMSLAVVHSSENFFNAKNSLDKKTEMINELDWLIDKELKTLSPKKWARAYFAHGMKHYLQTGQRLLPDYSGEANVFIDPRGDVFPCDVSGEKFGNIKEGKIEDMLRKPASASCKNSWMICTARPAMKIHIWEVLVWMVVNRMRAMIEK